MSLYRPQLLLFCQLDFWAEVTLNKSIEAGGRLLPPVGRRGREREIFGWRIVWVGDLGTARAAPAEPDQPQPCSHAPEASHGQQQLLGLP